MCIVGPMEIPIKFLGHEIGNFFFVVADMMRSLKSTKIIESNMNFSGWGGGRGEGGSYICMFLIKLMRMYVGNYDKTIHMCMYIASFHSRFL